MDDQARELQQLKSLSIEAIQAQWRQRLGTAPPRIRSLDVLVRLLAWRLQERDHGGLSAEVKARLKRLARERDIKSNKAPRPKRRATPGTVLAREWKGAMHRVAITGSGFEYAGKCYRSLSEVARTITGTRWSGPLFFGLKSSSRAERRHD
jgi:hypothetical protein